MFIDVIDVCVCSILSRVEMIIFNNQINVSDVSVGSSIDGFNRDSNGGDCGVDAKIHLCMCVLRLNVYVVMRICWAKVRTYM